ncbi:steroid C27-monooxygenase domain protein [Mycobacterium kansasii 824]|nr:steroid C27-monooxygenase domain protein [Mycobacterium kansasii 824]
MTCPSLPAGFDFTDPDIYARRLPVDELAELRRVAPIWWNDQPIGKGGFNDGGFWVVTKHKDVKDISLRSDVFSTYVNTAIPRFPDDMKRENIDMQRSVLLNIDAPHHTRLRKIISRGFTRGPSGGCAANSTSVHTTSSKMLPHKGPVTSSNRCPASCRCRPSPACWGWRKKIEPNCFAGPTK